MSDTTPLADDRHRPRWVAPATLSEAQTLDASSPAEAIRTARHWIARSTSGFSADLVADASLLTSELVSNAIQHGAPDVVVHVEIRGSHVEIGVSDGAPNTPPREVTSVDDTDTHGRGLMILAALAATWGVRPRRVGRGKTVYFTLDGATD